MASPTNIIVKYMACFAAKMGCVKSEKKAIRATLLSGINAMKRLVASTMNWAVDKNNITTPARIIGMLGRLYLLRLVRI